MSETDGYFLTTSNIELYWKFNDFGHEKTIFCIHGIAEHLGRHEYLVDLFSEEFNIFRFDLRGHGRSRGKRVDADNFYDYMEETNEIIPYALDKFDIKSYRLFGHSMGALVTSGLMQSFLKNEHYPELIYLSSPPIGVANIAGLIGKRVPPFALEGIVKSPLNLKINTKNDLKYLSHDKKVIEDYINDPYTETRLNSNLLVSLLKASREVFSKPLGIKKEVPVYASIGSKDRVVCPKSFKNYMTSVDSSIHSRIFDGAFHEIHNETDEYKLPYFQYLKSKLGHMPF